MDGLNQFLQQVPNFMPNFCDRCGSRHSKSDLEVVNRDGDKVVCRLNCKACGNMYLMQVNLLPDGGVSAKRASILSDISPLEVKKFTNQDKIENDEILDVIIAIKSVKRLEDFNVLFEERNGDQITFRN